MIHKLAKETLPIITHHILYDFLVHRLSYLEAVKDIIFPNYSSNSRECALQISSNSINLLTSGMPVLWKCSFTDGKESVEIPMLKRSSCKSRNLIALCTPQVNAEHLCLWTLVLTTHPHLAPRLRKSRAIPLLLLWAFIASSRVSFTSVNLPRFPDNPVMDKTVFAVACCATVLHTKNEMEKILPSFSLFPHKSH